MAMTGMILQRIRGQPRFDLHHLAGSSTGYGAHPRHDRDASKARFL